MEPVTLQILISTGGVLLSGVAATALSEHSRIKALKLGRESENEAWITKRNHEEKSEKADAYRQLLIDIDDLDTILTTAFQSSPARLTPTGVEAAERKMKAQVATVLLLIDDDALEASIRAASDRLSHTRLRTIEAAQAREEVATFLPHDHKTEMLKRTKEILRAFRNDLR